MKLIYFFVLSFYGIKAILKFKLSLAQGFIFISGYIKHFSLNFLLFLLRVPTHYFIDPTNCRNVFAFFVPQVNVRNINVDKLLRKTAQVLKPYSQPYVLSSLT